VLLVSLVVVKHSGLDWRRLLKACVAILLISSAGAVLLIRVPPITSCRSEIHNNSKEYWVPAIETVAQPWKGRHHVYGIFVIPEQYKYDHLYSAKLSIQGFETEFSAGSSEDEDPYAATARPGYYVKRVYISTRTAVWFLFTGRFGDLRTACHWWLVLKDRGWKPTEKS